MSLMPLTTAKPSEAKGLGLFSLPHTHIVVFDRAQLIKACADAGIPLISCMGAGARHDPSRVQVAFLSETANDPLCRKMRVILRHMGVDVERVPVVYSTEVPPVKLLELEDDAAEKPEDYQLLPDFRVRIMPVVCTVPAAVGNSAAAFVLNTISGKMEQRPMQPMTVQLSKVSKMLFDLNRSEGNRGQGREQRFLSLQDAHWAVTETFSGRCAVTGAVGELTLRRWRPQEPASSANVVLLSKAAARQHDAAETLEDLYSAEVIARVEAQLAREPKLIELLGL